MQHSCTEELSLPKLVLSFWMRHVKVTKTLHCFAPEFGCLPGVLLRVPAVLQVAVLADLKVLIELCSLF